ncbi:MAG: hypothetical protein HOB18_11850 [Nitrospina sp.]|jgi:hypothetical protein|nr:hypothetical protein [Nitrospina sp.]
MKHWIKTTLGIGLAIGLWQVSADARFLDLKKQEQVPPAPAPLSIPTPQPTEPSTSYNTEVAPKGISLRFENLSLISVLQNIQEETGILFSIDPSMETVPFSATIQADNWEAAVRELLKGFSRVEVWTDNLETSRIWVMAGQELQAENFQRNADIRLSRQAPQTPAAQQPQKKPRFRVAPAPAPVPVANAAVRIEDLPPHILFEPGVLTFFKSKGIALPQNVKNMFGPNLEGLPANMPISPHILNDPTFTGFLQSKGFQPPQS